jgi:hypothetical protein
MLETIPLDLIFIFINESAQDNTFYTFLLAATLPAPFAIFTHPLAPNWFLQNNFLKSPFI